jgi:hypothetical protein
LKRAVNFTKKKHGLTLSKSLLPTSEAILQRAFRWSPKWFIGRKIARYGL